MCNTVRLAEKLGVDTITCFSGCPGDCEDSKYPNWVTCAWPDDNLEILKYQWEKVLIPYWRNFVQIAKEYGVNKIALELHPGFCVYNVDIAEAGSETRPVRKLASTLTPATCSGREWIRSL